MRLLFLESILLTKKLPKQKKFLSRLPIILKLGHFLNKLLFIFVLVKISKFFFSKTGILIINKNNYNNKF